MITSLPGTTARPDLIVGGSTQSDGTPPPSLPCYPAVHTLNCFGYFPLISTISGLGRTLLGIIHTIAHLAKGVFLKSQDWKEESCAGLKNIGRGVIEMIPIVGNLTTMVIDMLRANSYATFLQAEYKKANHPADTRFLTNNGTTVYTAKNEDVYDIVKAISNPNQNPTVKVTMDRSHPLFNRTAIAYFSAYAHTRCGLFDIEITPLTSGKTEHKKKERHPDPFCLAPASLSKNLPSKME
jgi:hypothetical protein